MKTNVIARIELDGLHNWPAAKDVFPEVDSYQICIGINGLSKPKR